MEGCRERATGCTGGFKGGLIGEVLELGEASSPNAPSLLQPRTSTLDDVWLSFLGRNHTAQQEGFHEAPSNVGPMIPFLHCLKGCQGGKNLLNASARGSGLQYDAGSQGLSQAT